MPGLVGREGLDDLAQAGEGEVDALALREGVAGVGADPRLAVSLTARQVHQVQLGLPDVLVAEGVAVDDLEVDGEDGVGPGGVGVHGGGGGDPVGDALLEEHGDLGDGVDHVHGQPVNSVLLRRNESDFICSS